MVLKAKAPAPRNGSRRSGPAACHLAGISSCPLRKKVALLTVNAPAVPPIDNAATSSITTAFNKNIFLFMHLPPLRLRG
jgi:hypothetical protein